MLEVMKITVTFCKRPHAQTATLSVPNPPAGHLNLCLCQRLLDTHRQVCISLLWGHCSFLLGPAVCKVLFVPCKSVSPVLCKFWRLYGGLMATSSKKAYAIPRSAAPRAPAPVAGHCWPTPPQETLNTQRQVWLSLCGVSWCSQGFV